MVRILFTAILLGTCSAVAQVALPPVQLPRLPQVQLPVDPEKTVSGVTGALDTQVRQLVELRGLRTRELLRQNRDVIEADPRGAPMIRAEVVAFSPSDEALESARAAGFYVAREQVLEGLETRIVVLRAPAGMSTRRALARLKKIDPQGAYDFNHVYLESGAVAEGKENATAPPAAAPRAESSVKVGLIDGGVYSANPAFQSSAVHSFGCGGKPVPTGHGTAVASLLMQAAPGAQLYTADVYCAKPTGGAVDAVAQALAWMARERVAVINVSLVGPPNTALENLIRLVNARGHLVVAAVGNDGPTAPPLYPAAYDGVVGVTGVDAQRKVLFEAVRGPQVDFAAPGADLVAADSAQTYASVRGTSFAAPLVAGLLALQMTVPDKAAGARAVSALVSQAIDLGAKGRDRVYGDGLVGQAFLKK